MTVLLIVVAVYAALVLLGIAVGRSARDPRKVRRP